MVIVEVLKEKIDTGAERLGWIEVLGALVLFLTGKVTVMTEVNPSAVCGEVLVRPAALVVEFAGNGGIGELRRTQLPPTDDPDPDTETEISVDERNDCVLELPRELTVPMADEVALGGAVGPDFDMFKAAYGAVEVIKIGE